MKTAVNAVNRSIYLYWAGARYWAEIALGLAGIGAVGAVKHSELFHVKQSEVNDENIG